MKTSNFSRYVASQTPTFMRAELEKNAALSAAELARLAY
jgi:hypothetical protein